MTQQKLSIDDIKKIADTVINRESIDKYSKVVSQQTIRDNDYNLNIPRYVDSSMPDESYDIYATMFGGIPQSEISELNEYWSAFSTLKSDLFDDVEKEYTHLKTDNVKQTIMENGDIRAFINNFNASFESFNNYLKSRLLEQCKTLKIQKEQTMLGDDIFARLQNIPLIDKYVAYQILEDNWHIIATDLEIIQTEGFEATKQVDANMVVKKKDGKEQEIQDGWIGHIMSFDLVQTAYLKEELEALKAKEDRLLEITAEYEEILESLSEEEKELDTIKESKDGFVNTEVAKEAKQIRAEMKKKVKFEDDSYEMRMLKVDELIAEEKALKKEVKEESAKLHLKTKKTIEKLSDVQVYELLELKWIQPLENEIAKLPNGIISTLVNKVQELAQKYETTLKNIEDEIKETSKELSVMIDELEGCEFDKEGLKALQELLEVE
jgi:type I restriction enzyme M protein